MYNSAPTEAEAPGCRLTGYPSAARLATKAYAKSAPVSQHHHLTQLVLAEALGVLGPPEQPAN
jgi:hypothetical protein